MYSDDMVHIWTSLLGRPVNKIAGLLIREYGSLRNAYLVRNFDDITCEISNNRLLYQRLLDESIKDRAARIYERVLEKGVRVTHVYMKDYPENLKNIFDPPFVLYYYGNLPDKNMTLLSVVGSRKCSAYGRKATYELSFNIAKHGVGIVSGMAKGIDARAHAGCLDANGYTIAVLGGGPDNIYPLENEVIYYRIRENGLVVSEYPPGTMPLRHHFPARNRIIAGLGKGLLVCEAGKKSGAMITVNFALNEGRDIFSVPGNIDSSYSEGCNCLIKAGATLVTDYMDVLEGLNMIEGRKIAGTVGWLNGLDKDEAMVADLIYRGIKPDDICDKTGLDISRVAAITTILEVKGILGRDRHGNLHVVI